jgi:hypothetical protein
VGPTDKRYDRVLTFRSVHDAMRAEKLFEAVGLPVIAAPTPREISLSCGQSLLLTAADEAAAMDALAGAGASWQKLYRREAAARVYELLREYGG